MSQTYRAVIKQAGAWWIGWIEGGQGVKCQERSHEESLETPSDHARGGAGTSSRKRATRRAKASKRSDRRMKREEPLLHLRKHGCVMLREGGRQCWWHNPDRNRRSAAPRHREIHDQLAGKICRDLGVPPVKGF